MGVMLGEQAARAVAGRFGRVAVTAGGVAMVAVAVTAAVPAARLAYRGGEFQAAVETAIALIALLAAFLLTGRPARSGARADLLLALGFGILALTSLCLGAIPRSLGARTTDFLAWSAVLGTAAGVTCLACAGLAGRGRVPLRRPVVGIASASAGAVGLVALAAVAVAAAVPAELSTETAPSDSPLLDGHPLLNVLHGAVAALFAAASVASLRLVDRRGDELVGWVAAGTALAAAGWTSYLLMPVSATSWVALGDVLRLGFHLLVLVGAVREIGSYQRRLVTAAIGDERRRIAREVHDGLAQDLAYISLAIDESDGAPAPPDLREAARRATVEARSLLDALVGREPSPDGELQDAARAVAELYGIELDCSLEPGAHVGPDQLHCLERVVIEAIRNAGRHGRARRVELRLVRNGRGLRLRLTDDGSGFDAAAVPPDRFGLRAMEERVSALGGELRIGSARGAGTTVEVTLP